MSILAFMSNCVCCNETEDEPSTPLDSEEQSSHGIRKKTFEYTELEEATDNFNRSSNLGNGSYGTVYLGTLKDGHQVVIKHFDKSLSLHDEKLEGEIIRGFIKEVAMLTRLRHENLVQIYGTTSPDTCELVLVQEYIPNGSVDDHLLCRMEKPAGTLPWVNRLNIAVQTASALAYLHSSGIIHCDVKTRNILLDSSFNAKVADFGLSCLSRLGVKRISSSPIGTPGYLDPEYYQRSQLSNKSDVYSFGVVLIELISSKPAFCDYEEQPLLSKFAINKIIHEQLDDLFDPALRFKSDKWVRETVTAVAELAFRCLYRKSKTRPSMAEVFDTLKSIRADSLQVLPGSD